MNVVEYIKAAALGEATETLDRFGPDSRLLAGGTDLLIEWRRPLSTKAVKVIDISSIASLKGITLQNGIVQLKPLATHAELCRSPIIREHAALLSSAASTVGSPQIRNRGTVGGNIMNAAACADAVPPLIALDAEAEMHSCAGARSVKMSDFFVKPYQTVSECNEILTSIRFAVLPPGTQSCFIKLGRRNALSISRLSVAAVVTRDISGVITDARIVPGAAFPVWRRAGEAEKMLVGERPSGELHRAAGNAVAGMMIAETGRRWSTQYKEPVIAVLVRRALEVCSV